MRDFFFSKYTFSCLFLKRWTWLHLSQNFARTSILALQKIRNSNPEVFLEKCTLKICSKFTGEHPCGSVISIKLESNFIENAFRHKRYPVNLLHIFRTPRNTSGWLLLKDEHGHISVKNLPGRLYCILQCNTRFWNNTTRFSQDLHRKRIG